MKERVTAFSRPWKHFSVSDGLTVVLSFQGFSIFLHNISQNLFDVTKIQGIHDGAMLTSHLHFQRVSVLS